MNFCNMRDREKEKELKIEIIESIIYRMQRTSINWKQNFCPRKIIRNFENHNLIEFSLHIRRMGSIEKIFTIF